MKHTVMAEDLGVDHWAAGPLEAGAVKFDKPGEYTYVCRDHPWAKAQLIVVP